MNKASKAMNKNQILPGALLILMTAALCAQSAPRTGEAVVAARVGKVEARVFTGTVHEGRTERKKLSEGESIGESTRVMTGKDGRACLVLSPGAILCMAPETELTFKQLRHAAEGLPKSEDDLIRRITIELHKGRIMVHASTPSPSRDIRIQTTEGLVEASGGTFVVAQTGDAEWALISEEYSQFITPEGGARTELPEGEAMELVRAEHGTSQLNSNPDLLESPVRKFEVCNCFFDDLDPFIYDPIEFDRAGLTEYIGTVDGFEFVGPSESVADVSPSIRRPVPGTKRNAPSASTPARAGRWDPARAWTWYEQVGVIKGVNYIPRNAVNSTAMWQEDTFDKDLIDEELGWAQKTGYTTLRVQLQYVVWAMDPDGFIDRMETFLDLAEKHDLRVVFVLFDDKNFAKRDPFTGPQPEPEPGVYNARWTPSPGADDALNRAMWPKLEEYVKSVVGEFKHDDRMVYWDLYNRTGDNDLWEKTLPLMDQTFLWAREVDPDQPLAVAAWSRLGSAMSTRMLERSDIITFQSFENASQVEDLLMLLRRFDRPVICSDWLMRQQDSTFEKLLPLFSVNRVGWFNRGLVRGKTQQWIQQKQYRSAADAEVWQQDVLNEDGEAYSDKEVELIQSFRFENN